jgi:predicted site-specific integrase-resolvase
VVAYTGAVDQPELEDVWLPGPAICERLTIHPETLRRWRRAGLPSIGSGKRLRYPWPRVLRWLAQRRDRG